MKEQLVIAIGSCISFGFVGYFLVKKVLLVIKNYQNDIKNDIAKAEKIKQDAVDLFNKYQDEAKELPVLIDGIVSKAQQEANEIIVNAQKIAKTKADFRIANAKNVIDRKGTEMLQEFDKRFISLSFNAIKDQSIIENNVDASQKDIVDKIIDFSDKKDSFH